MIITRVWAERFMAYDALDVRLPETGLVIVTGKNWEGKSSLVDAIAVGLWDKTLRGSPPWRDGEPGRLRIEGRDLAINREVTKGGTKKLVFNVHGLNSEAFATKAKAQAALGDVVGDFDVWRRTSVFSSHDAALFSEATDKERKQLLESVLGVTRFDVALERCRIELREVQRQSASTLSTAERINAVLEEQKKRLQDAEQVASEALPKVDFETLSSARDEVQAQLYEAQEALRSDPSRLKRDDSHLARAWSLKSNLELLASGACPTCERSVPKKHSEALRERFESAQRAADEIAQKAEVEAERLREARSERQAKAERLAVELSNIDMQIANAGEVTKRHEAAASKVEEIRSEVSKAEESLQVALGEAERLAVELRILRAAEEVLGLRGVRASILGRSLSGLQALANAHLSRIALKDGVALVLKPYAELKTGGAQNAIDLRIEGWMGSQHGYKAGSGGARRVVNIALLLALAEIADAAQGRQPGDLFFDEVFDALDADRVYAVSTILREIAQDRKVLVISHNRQLVEDLESHAALRLHVADHRIQERR